MQSPPSLCPLVAPSLSPPLLPQVARQFPEPMPVVLKARLGGTPEVMIHTNNTTLQLQPVIEVLAVASNSAFHSLFSINMVSEVGWVGLAGRVWTLGRPQFLPQAPHLLFSVHTGLVILSMFQDISASGPLHMP